MHWAAIGANRTFALVGVSENRCASPPRSRGAAITAGFAAFRKLELLWPGCTMLPMRLLQL